MSAVLKGPAAAFAIRPLAARPAATLEIVAAEPSPDSLERDALRAECERLNEALLTARREEETAVAAALEEGRAQGRAEMRADDEEKRALIEAALARASDAWRERLDALDGLAARLAGAAVAKVFGDWEQGSELVVRTARARLGTLRREAVIAVQVSAADFPDQAALEAGAAQAGGPGCRFAVDRDLEAGDCRIDLKLGAVDIGPRDQVAAIAALLDALADGGQA